MVARFSRYHGHIRRSAHSPQRGFGRQTVRPCRIRLTWNSWASAGGTIAIISSWARSKEALAGKRPRRPPTRWTWTSTGISGIPQVKISTQAAVLRPTPGRPSRTSSASSRGAVWVQSGWGGSPSRSRIAWIRGAFCFASPPGRIASSSSSMDELEEAIRPGGLAKQKAPRIQAILERLGDPPHPDWTQTAPREEALEVLLGLPGVGRKTAACVLIFTWGIPEIPVDVHVHRVGGRLGLFPAKASFERAHDEMMAIVPPADAHEFHVNLIRHGRTVCRPKPRCGECALRRMCPWYRENRAGTGAR